MPCIGDECVTQCKDPKEELLGALMGASWWQISDNPYPMQACRMLPMTGKVTHHPNTT
jgi:hypothetical protein